MKPKDVESKGFPEYSEEANKKDPKFKVGDHVRILKYKKNLCIPNISGFIQINSFNSQVNELETKIRSAEQKPNISILATIQSVTAVLNKIPDVTGFVKKKNDYGTEITSIKNDYVTKASLTSQLNYLKSQHIADEVKKVDARVKKRYY